VTTAASVAEQLRAILAALTGRDSMLAIGEATPLLRPPVALDSLTGTLLLREVEQRFGVDVAGEDLNLDALATLGTLAEFVAQRATADRAAKPR
jgi:acyl carrier protein